jgi:hypothetical protein
MQGASQIEGLKEGCRMAILFPFRRPLRAKLARSRRCSPSGTLPTRRVAEVAVQRNGNLAVQCGASEDNNGNISCLYWYEMILC